MAGCRERLDDGFGADSVPKVVGFGERRRLGIVGLVDQAGHFRKTGGAGRQKPLATGNQLVADAAPPNEQRLKDTVRGDRLREQLDVRGHAVRRVDIVRRDQADGAAVMPRLQLIDVMRVSAHAITSRQPFACDNGSVTKQAGQIVQR